MKRKILYWMLFLIILVSPLLFLHHLIGQLQYSISSHKPNFLLITIDTCRADRIGAYGNPDVLTAAMDRFSKVSSLFMRGYAPVPTTAPSHCTLLTGLNPDIHRVFTNGDTYRNQQQMIQEVLKTFGYHTGAFLSGYSLINRLSGLGRGFDVYDDTWSEVQVERAAPETTEAFLKWMNQYYDEPFFAWIHYFDPHSPYEPRGPLSNYYHLRNRPGAPVPASEEMKKKYDVYAQKALESKDFGLIVKDPTTQSAEKEIIDQNLKLYESEINHVDRQIGRVIEFLFEKEIFSRTNVFITSDHGEGFDHDYFFGHGDRLWESAISVPWMIKFGFQKNKDHLCRQVALHKDLFPTILKLAGMNYNLPGITGENLELLASSKLPRSELSWYCVAPPLPRKNLNQGLLLAGFDPRYKLIKNLTLDEFQIYDLINDPGELSPLNPPPESVLKRLHATIGSIYENGRFPQQASDRVNNEHDRSRLKQLGYIQ